MYPFKIKGKDLKAVHSLLTWHQIWRRTLFTIVNAPRSKQNVLHPTGTSHCGGYNHKAVVYALRDCHYRHIDTAKRYGCEEFLRAAIQESQVPRDDIFLATKLWPRDYGYQTTKQACLGSINRLGTDYLDMYMMHWPNCPMDMGNDPVQIREETWRAMEVLYDEGRCHAIGVSNFLVEHLSDLLDTCSVPPHVNQCEFHPYQNPAELRNFCAENGIQFEGYCPLANGKILGEEPVVRAAQALGKTAAQVLIRWSIQNAVVTIPKSTKEERVLENSQVFDFELSNDQMEILNELNQNMKVIDRDSIQAKVDANLPDGYRLRLTPQPQDEALILTN